MRIAHINNIANVAWTLARAQERLGHEAVVFGVEDTPFRCPEDVRIRGARGPLGWNAAMALQWRRLRGFDVIHVHGGIWASQYVYLLFKRRYPWTTLAVHLHGSETRTGKGLHHLRHADLVFHSTPDLSSRMPQSVWVPNPIDCGDRPKEVDNLIPRFGHFVSSARHKGTELVLRAFDEAFGPLQRDGEGTITRYRGRESELVVGQGAPHDQALKVMAGCDAVIDQIALYGIYGMVAIEAMALGKPVLGTVRLEWYRDCPIVTITEENASAQLRAIAKDPGLRRNLGVAGRTYVGRVHEATAVARRVLKAYYLARQQPPLGPEQAAPYWRRRGSSYAAQVSSPKVRGFYEAQASEVVERLDRLHVESIAEVGCGFGRIGERISGRAGVRWVGADLSHDQLVEARGRSAPIRPRLLEASATALPFRDSSADLVLAVEVLMHIPPEQIKSALSELWRVSRRYIHHIDWFEDYLIGYGTAWSWVHDYPTLWESFGAGPDVRRLRASGLQRAFLVTKPAPGSH